MRKLFTLVCVFAVIGATTTISNAAVPVVPKQSVTATAGGGSVLPAQALPKGYSLLNLARATAAFNVTDHSGAPPNVPFQMLVYRADNPPFYVSPGTMLYVPVLYNDNSPPIIGNFPPDLSDREALLNYWFSQQEFGVVYANVTVDGQVTTLGPDYVMGVNFATPLPDTATGYMTAAAVLAPLTKGHHTVEISALATGAALQALFGGPFEFSLEYTVIVR